jgi:hypothetical protein
MFPNKFAIFASVLGDRLKIKVINSSQVTRKEALGQGEQCGIYFFTQGLQGVAYLPFTMIVSYNIAKGFFFNNVKTDLEWHYVNNDWVDG